MRLSRNFTLSEFTKSETAIRLGIKNEPNAQEISNLQYLVDTVLQPVADKFKVVKVNSGFRSPALNKAINGAVNSQHLQGLAADIEVPGVTNYELAVWIAENLVFDQLILEFYSLGEPNSGWVHVSVTRGKPRMEKLTIGKTVRKSGLYA